MSRAKGDAAERELSNRLEDEYAFAAMPAGSSGSATTRPRPDVIAARERSCPRRGAWHTPRLLSQTYAIEVKAWSDATGQLASDEVDALRDFADRAGGDALVVVRPDLRSHDQWHVFEPLQLNRTDAGNHSVRQAELPGATLAEAFGPRRGRERGGD